MSQPTLHQFLTGATEGDAISGQAFLLRGWLRELGFASEIYAQHVHESVADEVKPLAAYRRSSGETWAIVRHSIGSAVADFLARQKLTLFLIYHNITPPAYFERIDPMRAEMARQGLAQLDTLRPHTGFAVADSAFNAKDLVAAGYENPAVFPITLRQDLYEGELSAQISAEMARSGPNLLFVSRLAPNKKQADLVKLLAHVRRIHPDARLHLIGTRWEVGYDKWVEQISAEMGLSDAVVIHGKVSNQELVTAYRTADLYVSMSEHEGFGVPLIESMYCELPVLAYASTAVPFTMASAGVLFTEKRYAELAELVDLLLSDTALRQRIIAGQTARVQAFLAPQTRQLFEGYLHQAGLLSPVTNNQ